jgi:xanthine/CO dehydrogenase XdhC/CoxF family maturation factor
MLMPMLLLMLMLTLMLLPATSVTSKTDDGAALPPPTVEAGRAGVARLLRAVRRCPSSVLTAAYLQAGASVCSRAVERCGRRHNRAAVVLMIHHHPTDRAVLSAARAGVFRREAQTMQ